VNLVGDLRWTLSRIGSAEVRSEGLFPNGSNEECADNDSEKQNRKSYEQLLYGFFGLLFVLFI